MKRSVFQFAASLLFLTAGALLGEDSLSGDFSKPAEITKRLEDARTGIARLPADADPVLRERLEQFAAACQFRLASLDVLAKARAERDKAAEAKLARAVAHKDRLLHYDRTSAQRMRVIDDAMPGRCAAPPAPAIMHCRPRSAALFA